MSERGPAYSRHQIADFCILAVLSILVVAYLIHVMSLSRHILNVILIIPASIVILVLCSLELIRQIRVGYTAPKEQESVLSVLPVMGMFSAYVITLPWIGFDVGTMLFVAGFLLVHGERRWYWAIAYGVVFGMVVVWSFANLLPYPMPMLILPTEYN